MKKGFTLVELAIVIVIIGLLVGGVLQGQELIKQAKIRAQISQIEKFNTALATFKSKYNALPGDLVAPQRFGFWNGAYYGNTANYLGNGVINDDDGLIEAIKANIEPKMFFVHLGQAKLIEGLLPYIISPASAACYNNGNYASTVGCNFVEGKIGKGGFSAHTARDGNLYYFFGMSNYDINLFNPYLYLSLSPNSVISPADSFLLDSKIDDGNPTTGNVLATRVTGDNSTNLSNDVTLNSCLGATNQVYNISDDRLLCRLSIKAITN